jgi:hypothetical protein
VSPYIRGKIAPIGNKNTFPREWIPINAFDKSSSFIVFCPWLQKDIGIPVFEDIEHGIQVKLIIGRIR